MLPLRSALLRLQLHAVKPFLKNTSIETHRKTQDRIGALCARVQQGKVHFTDVDFPLFSASWATPAQAEILPGVILYLHGGSYTSGNLEYARGFGGILSEYTGRRVLCAAYRLAPEHPFPAALEDAVFCYRYMLEEQGISPEHVAVVGESAGGGLAFCLCVRLKELGLPQPGRIVAFSPWTDLTLSGFSYLYNKRKDPTLFKNTLSLQASLYAYGRQADPLVSPVFADVAGLPPSLLFAGGNELLLDDSVTIAYKLNHAGSPCELHIAEGMWHVYILFGIAESAAALARIKEFLLEANI